MKCPMPMYGIPGMMVAPARERGLKLQSGRYIRSAGGRSREGAWIEMLVYTIPNGIAARRSREGAWIEMAHPCRYCTALASRSREGAWIEMVYIGATDTLLLGRSREGAWIEMMACVKACWMPQSLPRGSVD